MILTPELIACIVQAENAVILSRVKSVQKMEGNPLGVEARHFDHVLATLMQKHPDTWWNRVGGLTGDDEQLIDPILDWYRQFNIACAFDIVPHQSSESLVRQLAERGFYQSSFRTVFFGTLEADQPTLESTSRPNGVVVRECIGNDMEIFINLALETGIIPEGDARFWKEVARAEFAEWRCYVAYVDGELAAHGALYVRDRVGSFGFGATLEKFRSRGCQTTLLHARIADAASAGCDLVVVQANPGSVSERNLMRAGLRVAYTKAIWKKQN